MRTRPATVDAVVDGELLGVLVNKRQVVVARVDGRLHAIDGVCTHQGAELKNGRLEGETVVCRFHGSRFDIWTGAVVCPPAVRPVNRYEVTVEDGRIVIDGILVEVPVGYTGLRDTG